MVGKRSPVWGISSEDLVLHIESLAAPDRLFWDARKLKKDGLKFQSLDWKVFPRVTKAASGWEFVAQSDSSASATPATACKVTARIEQAACPFIAFTYREKEDHYTGCGSRLVKFDENGDVVAIFSPLGQPNNLPIQTATADDYLIEYLTEARKWAAENAENIWFGLCSCGAFCNPQKFDYDSIDFIRDFEKKALKEIQEDMTPSYSSMGDGTAI